MLLLLRKTEGLDRLSMSLELLRRQMAPFGAVAAIPSCLQQGRGNDDRAVHLPAQLFEPFGHVHGVADDRIFEKLLIAQRTREDLSIVYADADGDRW